MNRRPLSWEKYLAVLGLLALAGAIAYGVLDEVAALASMRPGTKERRLPTPVVTAPDIGTYETYYPNDHNPFVPWDIRAKETVKLADIATAKKTKVKQPPPIKPPPVIEPPPPPTLVYPKLAVGGGDAPRCVGLTGRGEDRAVLVQMAGEGEAKPMKVGESAGGWTLLAIDEIGITTFQDPSGRTQRIAIGSVSAVKPSGGATNSGPLANPGIQGTGTPGAALFTPPISPRPSGNRPPTMPPSVRTHQVMAGETLAAIAQQYLGDAGQWRRIADANPGIDPTQLKPGQTLRIPARNGPPRE